MLFSNPVAVSAGTTYVASYFDPNGHYSSTPWGLSSAVDNAPLHSIANSASANGVYGYGTTSSFPTSSFDSDNYWVDVLFRSTPPGQVTNVTATAGHLSASVGLGGAKHWRGEHLYDHAVHRLDRSDAHHRERVSGADEHYDDRAASRNRIHLQGSGVERSRRGTDLCGVQFGYPDSSDRA